MFPRLVIFVFVLVGCSSLKETPASEKYKNAGSFRWPNVHYSKVVGYLYSAVESVESMLDGGHLNSEALARHTVKSIELNADQIERLLIAIQKPATRDGIMNCFNPHHVFVFYAHDTQPLAAVEVCFECTRIASWPDKLSCAADFSALARLSAELGLGPKPLDNYLETLELRRTMRRNRKS